jgi:hypothetical protein
MHVAGTAARRFGRSRSLEQLVWCRVRNYFDDHVPEVILFNATDRLGLVDLGRASVIVSADNFEAGGEVRGAVSDIGPEREVTGSH